ncbi:MAG: hypothetical protein ACYCPO_15050 [Acidobacteriaceae bacterium]
MSENRDVMNAIAQPEFTEQILRSLYFRPAGSFAHKSAMIFAAALPVCIERHDPNFIATLRRQIGTHLALLLPKCLAACTIASEAIGQIVPTYRSNPWHFSSEQRRTAN